MKRCAFSGHRPDRFPWKEDEHDACCLKIKEALEKEIHAAVQDGYDYFIVGGAEGVDTWAGEIILKLKAECPALKLEMAKPYPSYNGNVTGEQHERLQALEKACDKVTYISDGLDEKADCFMRDCYMVDSCSRMIIVYDEAMAGQSGTKDTLLYARSSDVDVVQIRWMHL